MQETISKVKKKKNTLNSFSFRDKGEFEAQIRKTKKPNKKTENTEKKRKGLNK